MMRDVLSEPNVRRDGEAVVEPVRLWLRLLSCATMIEREIQARLRDRFGVSLARFDYLAQLDRAGEGELTMTELGQRLMVSGGNITGLTDRLEKEELVERRADPGDRRVQRIALTGKGRELFAGMAVEHNQWVREILAGLGGADADQMMSLLGKLKHSAESAEEQRRGAGMRKAQ